MKIISTINNEKLNIKINEKISLIYEKNEEKILKLLNEDKKINNILISENIIKIYFFEEFINKILKINKKIKLFIIFENKNNNKEKINYLIKNKINNYYFNNEILIEELVLNIFNENKIKKKLIHKFKEKINNKINIFKKIIKNKEFKSEKTKIICICGAKGVGKTTSIIKNFRYILRKFKKVLFIDMDEKNKNLYIYFNNKIENKFNKKIEIKLINNLFKNNKNINNIFINLKNIYNLIIIDNNLENNFNINKKILNNIDEIFFFIEPNLFGINNANKLLEKLILKYCVEKNKIKIIINKNNMYSINKNILNKIYSDYEIIKTIKYSKKYFLV